MTGPIHTLRAWWARRQMRRYIRRLAADGAIKFYAPVTKIEDRIDAKKRQGAKT
jgi:predicted kinase